MRASTDSKEAAIRALWRQELANGVFAIVIGLALLGVRYLNWFGLRELSWWLVLFGPLAGVLLCQLLLITIGFVALMFVRKERGE